MRIRRRSLAWTLVRPGIMTSGVAMGRSRALTEPSMWHDGRIAWSDVAGYIVRQIADPSHVGRAFVLVR